MKKSNFQEFIELLMQTLLSLLKVLLMSSFKRDRFVQEDKQGNCIILGNGPSLKTTIEESMALLQNHDIFAVNFFGRVNTTSKLSLNITLLYLLIIGQKVK